MSTRVDASFSGEHSVRLLMLAEPEPSAWKCTKSEGDSTYVCNTGLGLNGKESLFALRNVRKNALVWAMS